MDYTPLIEKLLNDHRLEILDWENLPIAADAIEALQASLTVREGQAAHWRAVAENAQTERDALQARVLELGDSLAELEITKDGAYAERNRLVSLLSKVFPSGKKKTAIEGWSEDWHGCVYIDLPTGQASWHYHEEQGWLFAHLPEYQGGWDGHTTNEKYERIQSIAAGAQVQPLTEFQKMDLATNWFGEDWAIKKAVSLIEDVEKAHGIGGSV